MQKPLIFKRKVYRTLAFRVFYFDSLLFKGTTRVCLNCRLTMVCSLGLMAFVLFVCLSFHPSVSVTAFLAFQFVWWCGAAIVKWIEQICLHLTHVQLFDLTAKSTHLQLTHGHMHRYSHQHIMQKENKLKSNFDITSKVTHARLCFVAVQINFYLETFVDNVKWNELRN